MSLLRTPDPKEIDKQYYQFTSEFSPHGTSPHQAVEPTLEELFDFVLEHEIPMRARVVYEGCGTHVVGLDWS